MTKAIRIHTFGGTDQMKFEDVTLAAPAKGEVRIKHTAIGLNYIDTYFRSGLYPAALPLTLGNEGAGVITALGEGVTGYKIGDRVAYYHAPGAYCEERNFPANRMVKIPDGISDQVAACMMLKGMTAQYLLKQLHKTQKGDVFLFQAAAGGVGQIFGQWAKALGATVIGTVGSDEKIAQAKANGYDHVINYTTEDFAARVKEITGGKGVDVAYDGVGKSTFPKVLDCIKPRGLFVTFGNASGAIDAFPVGMLAAKGSLFMTRPTLNSYTTTDADLAHTAGDVMDALAKGIIKININQTYALKDAAKAHEDLMGRKTTGNSVLIP
jgi:NADPH:quinone reductase